MRTPAREGRRTVPLFGLPNGDTPLLLAVTTVIELTKLVIVAHGLWRWN